MRAYINNLAWGLLIIIDQAANVVWGPDPRIPAAGNPHYTCSERFAELRTMGSARACQICLVLTWIARRLGSSTTDHCADSMAGMPWRIPENG